MRRPIVSPTRREILIAAALAVAVAAPFTALGPPAGDAPAHLYRTLLVREGAALWDNLWFGGQYPLVSYSLLYYVPAALVGNVPLVLFAVVLSAPLFTAVVLHEWGEAARWPSRLFGVLASAPLVTGTYSYGLGFLMLLATLRALQLRRPWVAVGCAGLSLGFSPLAFFFLCLVLLAAFLAGRRLAGRLRGQTLLLGAALALLAAVEFAVLAAFPTDGVYPFRVVELLCVLGVSAAAAYLAWRAPRGRVLATFLGLWALASAIGFLVPSPFGENLTRPRSMVLPLVLLAALLVRFAPRWLAVGAVAAALAYNVVPFAGVIPDRANAHAAGGSFWRPAVEFLRSHSSPDHRVEVVPTFDHWEAYWIPRAGFALARGWYRQIDLAQNRSLYRTPLTPAGYRGWLRRMGVRYVLLPNTRLGRIEAGREARLLRSGRVGLVEVFRSRDWTIYEYPSAVRILTGAGRARIISLGHERIDGWVAKRGTYRLLVRYTPFWKLRRGAVCLRRASDGMTLLEARRAGRFSLAIAEVSEALVRVALRREGAAC